MTIDEREVKRKQRIREYAEESGNTQNVAITPIANRSDQTLF